MSLIQTLADTAAPTVVSPLRLCFAEDGETIVPETDPRAATLAVAAGSQTSDPRVLRHLGYDLSDPRFAGLASAEPSVKGVETEQSPTANQIALAANSNSAPSVAEIGALQAKQAGPEPTPAETATVVENAEKPLEKPDAPALAADPVETSAPAAKAEAKPKAVKKPTQDKSIKPAQDKSIKPADDQSVAAPETPKEG